MELLFSYGTLQLEAVQLRTFGRRLIGRPDRLPGYRKELLEITDPAVVGASGKTHHPIVVHSGESADGVDGVVFEVTAEELARADAYEVTDYRRDRVMLASGLQAWAYLDGTADGRPRQGLSTTGPTHFCSSL